MNLESKTPAKPPTTQAGYGLGPGLKGRIPRACTRPRSWKKYLEVDVEDEFEELFNQLAQAMPTPRKRRRYRRDSP